MQIQAFEFQAEVQDGVIRIPQGIADIIPQKIRVIILPIETLMTETPPKTNENVKPSLANDYSKIGDFDLANYKEVPHVYVEDYPSTRH